LWHLPQPVAGSPHAFKYRLAYVVGGICVLRHANEAGKGDHQHRDGAETAYAVTTPEDLVANFHDCGNCADVLSFRLNSCCRQGWLSFNLTANRRPSTRAAFSSVNCVSFYAKTSDLAAYATVTQLAADALTTDLAAYAKTASLATVATTGQYSDLLGIPATTTASSNVPIAIKDYYPPGVSDSLTVPDLGLVQSLTVSVNLANSDVSGLTLTLTDPNGGSHVLYDKASTGTSLNKTFPALTGWVGKNAKGTWSLKVVDAAFLNAGTDGSVTSWSVTVQTLSQKQVAATGDFAVKGMLFGGDTGVLNVGGPLQVQGVPVARVWTAQRGALADGAYVEVATGVADLLVAVSGWVQFGAQWIVTGPGPGADTTTTCTVCGDGTDGDLVAYSNASMTVASGTYNLKSLKVGIGAHLSVVGSQPMYLKVQDTVLVAGDIRGCMHNRYVTPSRCVSRLIMAMYTHAFSLSVVSS